MKDHRTTTGSTSNLHSSSRCVGTTGSRRRTNVPVVVQVIRIIQHDLRQQWLVAPYHHHDSSLMVRSIRIPIKLLIVLSLLLHSMSCCCCSRRSTIQTRIMHHLQHLQKQSRTVSMTSVFHSRGGAQSQRQSSNTEENTEEATTKRTIIMNKAPILQHPNPQQPPSLSSTTKTTTESSSSLRKNTIDLISDNSKSKNHNNNKENQQRSAFLKVRSMTTLTNNNDDDDTITTGTTMIGTESKKEQQQQQKKHVLTKEQLRNHHPQLPPQDRIKNIKEATSSSSSSSSSVTSAPMTTTTTTTILPTDTSLLLRIEEEEELPRTTTTTTTTTKFTTNHGTMMMMFIQPIWNILHRIWQWIFWTAILGTTHGISTTTATGTSIRSIISVPTLYIYALIGSSIGFYIYVYFISIGHAIGIFLPVLITILRYIHRIQTLSLSISFPSLLHSILVLLWSIRLGGFLLWREYVSWWPALHYKIRQVQVPMIQKCIAWIIYSLYYTCLVSPCYFRLQSNIILQQQQAFQPMTFGRQMARMIRSLITYMGILLQVIGLSLETIADYQKSSFKSKQRQQRQSSQKIQPQQQWCHVGVWQYSTHPNYVGEWLFWFGTIITALPSTFLHATTTTTTTPLHRFGIPRSITNMISTLLKCSIMIMGLYILSIILYGAANKLDMKQRTKYGSTTTITNTTTDDDDIDNDDSNNDKNSNHNELSFLQYQATIGIFGPKRWYNRLSIKNNNNNNNNNNTTIMDDGSDTRTTNNNFTNHDAQQRLLQQQRQDHIQSTEALLDSTLAATEEETFR